MGTFPRAVLHVNRGLKGRMGRMGKLDEERDDRGTTRV